MKRKQKYGSKGKALTNDIFANALRKDPITRSINRHIAKKRKKK